MCAGMWTRWPEAGAIVCRRHVLARARSRSVERGLECLGGLPLAIGIDVQIDVRPERERGAPVADRQIRVELRGALERADRGFMIEPVQVLHPLIEVLLRLGVLRRYDPMEVAE